MAKSWYVLHTYSGHENKIEKTIRKIMEADSNFSEVVSNIKIPTEKVYDVKDGKKTERTQKVLPGYLLLEMDLPNSNWKQYTSQIHRLQGVSGFVGTSINSKPQPITTEEARNLFARMGEIKGDSSYRPRQNYTIDETVRIIDGPFETFTGTIVEIYEDKNRLKVMVGIFGRNTPVELDFRQVEKT